MIVMVGSRKGGCGKSTVAVNVAAELAGAGRHVVLVDTDAQQTATTWARDREEHGGLFKVHCTAQYDNISSALVELDGRYEYVVVDAAGRDSREWRTGMAVADLLIVPFRPSQIDLDTLPHLSDVAIEAKQLNDKLAVRALLTMVPTNPHVREVEEAREILADYPEVTPLAAMLRDRKVYRDAMSEGCGVSEMRNPKARQEVHQLMKELFQ